MALQLVFLIAVLQSAVSIVVDRPDSIVTGWTELSRTSPSKLIKLTFALKNQNTDLLEKTLLDVSTPGNPEYGNHRSVESLYEMTTPSLSSIEAVEVWLLEYFNAAQIIRETPNHDLWSVHTDIATAEKLLECEYWDYQSEWDNTITVSRIKLGTDYHVDAKVEDHLYFVSPTHRFPYFQHRLRVNEMNQTVTNDSVGALRLNPTTLRELYNMGDAKGSGSNSNNSQGVASFRNQYYSLDDCKAMWKKYDLEPCEVTDVPSNSPSGHHLEAELDTQYISSMGQAIPMQVWWTQGFNFKDAMLEFTNNMLSSKTRPPLISVSYGGPESDFGASYVTKLNNQFMMMGAAGISVLFASGDSGAGGGCSRGAFFPDYPAASPYVTAVGGVTGGKSGSNPLGESAWLDGGGGFSNYAVMPSWQRDAVSYYLKNGKDLPESNKYNATGRAFPDIAAQSVDFEIIVNGRAEGVSGTSCSSPTAGGIFAMLNDVRTRNGMSKLGFLNPFIYQTAAADATAFNDCTEGYNKGCGLETARGFYAYEKWDAASGYGSPNYAVLEKKVMETGKQTLKHQGQDGGRNVSGNRLKKLVGNIKEGSDRVVKYGSEGIVNMGKWLE